MMHAILTLNAGSSSVKFALFTGAPEPAEISRGQIEGLGSRVHVSFKAADGRVLAERDRESGAIDGHDGALRAVLDLLSANHPERAIVAVGHRIVHGGADYALPVVLDDGAIAKLRELEPLAPLHQPHNLAGVAAARRAFPGAAQVACFDTAFHRTQPWVNDTFALPRAFYDRGIRRYGFHGLSYEFIAAELRRLAPDAAKGRVIAAHLGNGASMCAMIDGRAVATTMGFSPLDGLPMGTRCGQIDPGVLLYLLGQKGMDAERLGDLLYRESGLLGLSGVSHDVRALENDGTPEASAALDYFVARAVRELGGLAATLGGIDAVVFSGGIGENSWRIRERICEALAWLGLALDGDANRASRTVISADRSTIGAYVIRTSEETMIARHVARLIGP